MKKLILTLTPVIALVFTINVNASAIGVKPPLSKIHRVNGALSADELKKNMEYDFSRSSIRSAYYEKLDQLARLLLDKKCAIALRGYADSIGTFKGNWHLSQKRADVVKSYLIKKGVPSDKIVTTAFGSTVPIASNKTAEGRQKNRRVEIKIDDNNQ